MFSLPRVDPVTMTMSPSYSYGWSLSDKNMAQEVDQAGRSTGGYSWSMPGGGSASFAHGSGHYVDGLNSLVNYGADQRMRPQSSDYEGHSSMKMENYGSVNSIDIGHNSIMKYGHSQYDSDDIGHNSVRNYGYGQYDSNVGHTSKLNYQPSSPSQSPLWSTPSTPNPKRTDSSYVMRIVGPESQWVERSDPAGERSGYYSYLTGRGERVMVRYSAGRQGFSVLDSLNT